MLRFLRIYFLFFCGLSATWAQDEVTTVTCSSDFDLFLILDTSRSLRGYLTRDVVPFVEKLVASHTNPNLRISIITFNNTAKVQLALTADREQVQAAIKRLNDTGGNTYLSPAIVKAREQITAERNRSRTSVLLIVTDGELNKDDSSKAEAESKEVKKLGAIIATVGAGEVNRTQLENIATNNSLVFIINNTSGLSALVELIVQRTCPIIDEPPLPPDDRLWIVIICFCCIVSIIGCLLLTLVCAFCNRVRRLKRRGTSDITITVRGRALKKPLPVTLQITNKQVHAGVPREGRVKVQREEQETREVAVSNSVGEQETCEVAVCNGAAVPVKGEKHRSRKSKKTVAVISCSSPPT